MTESNLLQLGLRELKVIKVQVAGRLEAPSHGAEEFIVEALLSQLVQE